MEEEGAAIASEESVNCDAVRSMAERSSVDSRPSLAVAKGEDEKALVEDSRTRILRRDERLLSFKEVVADFLLLPGGLPGRGRPVALPPSSIL